MHDHVAFAGRFTGHGQRAAGRVLPDTVAVLVVAGLLAGMAAPSLRAGWQARRAAAEAQSFAQDLGYARAEAARRGQRVGLCAGSLPACGLRNGWGEGRVVWVDLDGDGRPGPGEPVLREVPAWGTGDSLFDTRGSARIAFTPDGRMEGLPAAQRTWALRADGQDTVHCIRINNAGRTLLDTKRGSCV